MDQRDFIVVAAFSSDAGALKIDIKKALKVLSAISSLALGPKGVPTFLSNIGDLADLVKREFSAKEKIEAQGFVLFSSALTSAIVDLLRDHAPNMVGHADSVLTVARLVLGAMEKEVVRVGPRFFRTPGLNPAFMRVRESLAALLDRPYFKVDPVTAQLITSRLGATFSQALHEAVQAASGGSGFQEFLSAAASHPFSEAADRAWRWDEYRSDLNRQAYRRLFLHELDGHPDVSLPDLYVPSRAIYRDNIEAAEGGIVEEKKALYCVDLATELRTSWLGKSVKSAGHSRLVTGDPGTGKSTFSLLFGRDLSEEGYRVLFIPANSIRSLGLSFTKIIETHIQRTLRIEQQPNIELELVDPDATKRPLIIILDGLDEYDVGGNTVSLAAARLVDHVMMVMDEWIHHGHEVRLLLCGRPEAASSLTRFRELGHHLHVTGFVAEKAFGDIFVNDKSERLLSVDQREEWWRKWRHFSKDETAGLPDAIRNGGEEVREITAQPLLNYMLAVLKLYTPENLTNLSALYGALFAKYFERQSQGKSGTFEKICPSLDRFRRIMSEIGLAAWHAGDRSVSVFDLQARFNKPPLKSWFDKAGAANSGMAAILSAFYTRPEDAADPDSGLAQRYVFTHKSFREYLTGVGIVRFLIRLAEQLHPEAENGWSDQDTMREWLGLFGSTAFDERQWEFLTTELQTAFLGKSDRLASVKAAVEHVLGLALRRKMAIPPDPSSLDDVLSRVGNAEEAILGVLSALSRSAGTGLTVNVDWPDQGDEGTSNDGWQTALTEMMYRIRSRPGSPDEFMVRHVGCLFQLGGENLNRQIMTVIRRRSDGWEYARAFDFTGLELSGATLSGADLIFSRFHRATIGGAKFDEVTMNMADMAHVATSNNIGEGEPVSFRGARLHASRWNHAKLEAPSFEGAVLRGADLRGLTNNFKGADLEHAITGVLDYHDDPEEVEDRPKKRRRSRRPV